MFIYIIMRLFDVQTGQVVLRYYRIGMSQHLPYGIL